MSRVVLVVRGQRRLLRRQQCTHNSKILTKKVPLLLKNRKNENVIVSASSSSSSNSSTASSFVVERAEVREEKRKFLAEAKIEFLDEFEVRAQIDAAATERIDLSNMGLREYFDECMDRDRIVEFLERDIERCARAFVEELLAQNKNNSSKNVVVSLSLLRRTLCTKLHVDYVPLRMMVTYFGKRTEVLDERSIVSRVISKAAKPDASKALVYLSDFLKSKASLYDRVLVKELGDECDLLFLRGEKFKDKSGMASVHRSPMLSSDDDWRLVLRIDLADHVNESIVHQKCISEILEA